MGANDNAKVFDLDLFLEFILKSMFIKINFQSLFIDVFQKHANEIDGADGPDEGRGAALIALSADDGTELGRCSLDSIPVFDGMAAAYGRLYISMKNGSLLCLEK